jgi:hypothetical protein
MTDRILTENLHLREQCLSVLLQKYGNEVTDQGMPIHSTRSIYECANEWVEKGNKKTDGLVKYYAAYYKTA